MPDDAPQPELPEADGSPGPPASDPLDPGSQQPEATAGGSELTPEVTADGSDLTPEATEPTADADLGSVGGGTGGGTTLPPVSPNGRDARPTLPAAESSEPTGETAAPVGPSAAEPPGPEAGVGPEAASAATSDSANALSQSELDALAGELSGEVPLKRPATIATPEAAGGAVFDADADLDRSIAEAMAEATGGGTDSTDATSGSPAVVGAVPVRVSPQDAKPFTAPELARESAPDAASIDMLDDVQLDVKIELGRTNMYIEDVLRLGVGSVVELDKLAGDPVDIFVNERLIARGEVLVLNDNFCVRINAIHSPVPELEQA